MRTTAKADYAVRAAVELAAVGGYVPARAADEISLADVIRAVDGPLSDVRGHAPEALAYPGSAEKLRDVWIALRANVRTVLGGELPAQVEELLRDEDAWSRR